MKSEAHISMGGRQKNSLIIGVIANFFYQKMLVNTLAKKHIKNYST